MTSFVLAFLQASDGRYDSEQNVRENNDGDSERIHEEIWPNSGLNYVEMRHTLVFRTHSTTTLILRFRAVI